jgi:hypothetical protein
MDVNAIRFDTGARRDQRAGLGDDEKQRDQDDRERQRQ